MVTYFKPTLNLKSHSYDDNFGNVYIWYVCILGVRPCVQCSMLYRCTAFAEATV